MRFFKSNKKATSSHEEWWESFWSNVAATVLGIVLTFGVSEWLERREERQNAEALVERSFKNLERRLRNLDNAISSLDQQDSLIIVCQKALPDKLDSVPIEVFHELIGTICLRWYSFESNAVETAFKQDLNSQKILGDFADVLSDAFETMSNAEIVNQRVNEQKIEFHHIGTKYWGMNLQSMDREECISLLTNPDALFTLDMNAIDAQLMRRISRYLHNYLEKAHALWNKEITYKEFEVQAVKKTI